MAEATEKCSVMTRSELFAGIPSSACTNIVSMARPIDLMCRQVMYFAGDPIEQILLLTEGRVKITQCSEHGSELIVRLCIPGDLISELPLVPGSRHSSTAQALQDCKVLAWDSATFEAASVRFPALRRNAHHILERRLAELECRFSVVSTKTASPRLASGLVHLMDKLGQRVNSHIEINITQEVLAQMTAMTSFQVCHLLNLWKGQGLVNLRKETIEIHSVPRLMDLCRAK